MPTDMCAKLKNVSHSIGHPDLSDIGSPQGKTGTTAYRENCCKKKFLSTENAASSSQASFKSKKAKRSCDSLGRQTCF